MCISLFTCRVWQIVQCGPCGTAWYNWCILHHFHSDCKSNTCTHTHNIIIIIIQLLNIIMITIPYMHVCVHVLCHVLYMAQLVLHHRSLPVEVMHWERIVSWDWVEALSSLNCFIKCLPVVVFSVTWTRERERRGERVIDIQSKWKTGTHKKPNTSVFVFTREERWDTSGQADTIKIIIKDFIVLDDSTPTISHLNPGCFPSEYSIMTQNRLTVWWNEYTCNGEMITNCMQGFMQTYNELLQPNIEHVRA